jgi:hypothetical protein
MLVGDNKREIMGDPRHFAKYGMPKSKGFAMIYIDAVK